MAISMPENRSLKEKRKVVRGLTDRLRQRHRISVAEIGSLDVHTRGEVGFAVVGNDRTYVRSRIEDVLRTAVETCPAEIVDEEIEVIEW
jgi:uncharacterized protein YlxP (DUF503 family)